MAKSNKSILRIKYQNIRNEIRDKNEKSDLICEKILNTEIYKKSNVIAVYRNLPSETDTTLLIEEALKQGKTVALPRVIGENVIQFYKIQDLENFEISDLGIEEPPMVDENFISEDSIDLIIVPAVSFDLEKNRLGFGKGCYDYYLEESNFYKIGICFDEQISDINFNNDRFDIRMDLVITEKREIK